MDLWHALEITETNMMLSFPLSITVYHQRLLCANDKRLFMPIFVIYQRELAEKYVWKLSQG